MTGKSVDKSSWGVSYGEMVAREFFKSKLNTVCLIFIIFLFVIAVFAPFLANDKPFVIRIDDQLHFPILPLRLINSIYFHKHNSLILGNVSIYIIYILYIRYILHL